jgi:hypothetical protein
VDDNCDGQTDEGVKLIFYADSDSDGYGDANAPTEACSAPLGYVSDKTDCNDGNAAINPGATEVCNGADDNCDGQTDEGGVCPATAYYCDNDTDQYISAIPSGSCNSFNCVPAGCTSSQGNDCNDNNKDINPGAAEVCNGIDDNCNGATDEGGVCPATAYYCDNDHDSHVSSSISETCTTFGCVPTGFNCQLNIGDDCADSDNEMYPGAQEKCDGKPNDCNNMSALDGSGENWYNAPTTCGTGAFCTSAGTWQCIAGIKEDTCTPGSPETLYRDSDSDAFGNATSSIQNCDNVSGYVLDSTDCDDNDDTTNPGAQDICSINHVVIDKNCNTGNDAGLDCNNFCGDVDQDSYVTSYVDLPFFNAIICPWVTNEGDCNDNIFAIHPGATETCNGDDDNCDGATDEGGVCPALTYYCDADNDNYRSSAASGTCSTFGCVPVGCATIQGTDCKDNNALIHPNAPELCNGVDDNCNGVIDENCPSILKSDALANLSSMTSSVKDAQKHMEEAAKEIRSSLGNMNPDGDKKIIWMSSENLFCRDGKKVFDHEKKAVSKLQEAIKKDPTKATVLNGIISSLVSVDRGIALASINKMPAGKEKAKAMEKLSKGDSEADPKKKIDRYRDAWKYSNKKCDDKNIDVSPCIEEITVLSPGGDEVTMIGDYVGYKNTVFEDINEDTISIDTSCMKCLSVGQILKSGKDSWTITDIVFKAPLSSKCQK